MTFNKKDLKEKILTVQSPLFKSDFNTDNEISYMIDQIEINFMDFSRYYNIIKDFARKIPFLTRKEYDKTKDDVHYKIQLIPSILNSINSNTNKIYSFNKSELSSETLEKLEVIKEKLNPKVAEIPLLINNIYEQEKIASLKLRNIKLSESQLDDSLSFMHNRSDNLRESKLFVSEVFENHKYLEKRKDELESIKKVSNQLREITVMMGLEVKNQGEALNQIFNEVEEARDNVIMGESEIFEAEQNSRKQINKIILLSIFLIFAVAALITIIVLLFQ